MGTEKRVKYDHSNPRLPVFTERFRSLTEDRGGVSEMARVTGFSRPTVQFWYNGERTPDAENLITLSRTLGVSVDYLLGLSGTPTTDPELRGVVNYTGLSEKALHVLCNYKEDFVYADGHTGPGNWLTEILCCRKLKHIISLLTQLRDIRIFVDVFIDMLEKIKGGAGVDDDDVRSFCEDYFHEIPSANDLYKKVEKLFLRWYEELKLIRFELSELFSDFVEEYEPTKDLIELGSKYYYFSDNDSEE